ncbi:MAG: glycosyltransferase [Propionivibrio sp.]|nr:glycosyltransferase [Propionivibrio sp.]
MEALACECPVIASDLLATREIILDGETGFLCKQGDREELVLKIITLLANQPLRHKMGQAGRIYVSQRFDWQGVAHRYSDLLNRVSHK